MAEDDANPLLSDKKFDYAPIQTIFKAPATKFREDGKDVMENVTISIEKFESAPDVLLNVRMPNKCIAFGGKLIENITTARFVSSGTKNVGLTKIFKSGVNEGQPAFSSVKIQFKDDVTGDQFKKEVDKLAKTEKLA